MKEVILRIMIFILNIIYSILKLLPQQNKIVFISRQSNSINIDFLLLGNELKKKHEVVYLCKTLEKNIKSALDYGIHIFKQMYHLATSKVCILDSYSPAVSVLHHKKSLTIIQIWHSIGTMKKFGCAILDKEEGNSKEISRIMKQHKNYDIIFCSSDAYKEDLAKGFGCKTDKIINMTLPKVDLLLDTTYQENKKKEILDYYPKLTERKNILYCPTFRRKEEEFEKVVNEMAEKIDYNKYNLIIKLHSLSKVNINNENAIVDNKFTTFEMLSVADKVISDYSCVIYEAGILNIPLYFYNFDMENYEIVRGLAIEYNELPGYTASNLEKLLENLEKDYDYDYLNKFIEKYVTNKNQCTAKMVNKIEEYL